MPAAKPAPTWSAATSDPTPDNFTQTPAAGRITHFRWIILLLVFLGSTINYVDRLVMGILAPDLQKRYAITDLQYGYIQSTFAFVYAIGQCISGGLLDRIGMRLGYAVSLTFWSLTSMAHALARGAMSFGFMRGLLGFAESPFYPGAAKTLAEWFPKRERAFAYGFVNAGTNMGAIVAPAVVPWLAINFGWQWAFIGTGAVGFIWVLFWVPLYRKPHDHPRVSPAELALINSDPPEPPAKIPWLRLMGYRQAWAFAAGKFLTDSMWWFYMTWLPKFLYDHHHLDLSHIGLPLVVIYLMSDIGSISGGWISSFLIKRGATVNVARKTAMLLCALGVLPIMFTQQVSGLWPAVLILGLATAAHQGFSSNLYTLVSDMFPRRAVGSIAGMGGMWGYGGASVFQIVVGTLVEKHQNYTIPFICAALAYLLALAAIHVLAPRLEPVVADKDRDFQLPETNV
jgi:ACS family hexuronate transporter-like MFS transporter